MGIASAQETVPHVGAVFLSAPDALYPPRLGRQDDPWLIWSAVELPPQSLARLTRLTLRRPLLPFVVQEVSSAHHPTTKALVGNRPEPCRCSQKITVASEDTGLPRIVPGP